MINNLAFFLSYAFISVQFWPNLFISTIKCYQSDFCMQFFLLKLALKEEEFMYILSLLS